VALSPFQSPFQIDLRQARAVPWQAMGAIVVITTVGTEEQANLIAREIVARRQAACVNILPGVRSIYRWKGKICKDGELMLVVKTLEQELDGVSATIRELHSYELPEILSFQAIRGEANFLEWIAGSVDKSELSDDDEDEDELVYAADPEEAD
jgi:periplasmic divalent cation tolerance protein